eukprot:3571293-Prymnesium_polylepis.1
MGLTKINAFEPSLFKHHSLALWQTGPLLRDIQRLALQVPLQDPPAVRILFTQAMEVFAPPTRAARAARIGVGGRMLADVAGVADVLHRTMSTRR